MFKFIHQLVTNYVCLLVVAGQVAHSGFIAPLFLGWKQLPAAAGKEFDESGAKTL